jgi:hypothetical protein
MATYLITGVTAGDTSALSEDTHVANKADTLAPQGWDSTAIPLPVASPGGNGASVLIDLSYGYAPPPGTALSLALSGPPLVLAGLGPVSQYGQPQIENAAQGVTGQGINSLTFGGRLRTGSESIGRDVRLSLEGGYTPPISLNVGLYLDGVPLVAGASVGMTDEYGTALVESPLSIRPTGFDSARIRIPVAHEGGNGSFVDISLVHDYQPSKGTAISLPLSGAPLVLGAMGDQALFGSTIVENAAQAAYPSGIEPFVFGMGLRVFDPENNGGGLALDLIGNYEPPSAQAIQLLWASEDKSIAPLGMGGEVFGTAIIRVERLFIDGIPPHELPEPGIRNRNRKIQPVGEDWFAPGVHHTVENAGVAIYPKGVVLSGYGRPETYNLLQFLRAKAFDTGYVSKDAFLSGGVKYIKPSGSSLLGIGKANVVNTTANQTVSLKGIDDFGYGKPSLSPRMIYPPSIYGTASVGPIVQFPPRPPGWDSARMGDPTVEYWVTYAYAEGIETGEIIGNPKVFDPRQFIYPRTILGTGIFGDVTAFNLSVFTYPEGIDSFEGSDWAEVRSNKRSIEAVGIVGPAASETSISNKTPSIIPDGVEPLTPSSQFIAFRIRYVYGRGSDQLATGAAKVTQPPSISPAGMAGLTGIPTVWHRIRTLFASGKNTDLHGTPSIWFRYRHIEHEGKDQGAHGNLLIEHGRRHLLALGSQLDRHGMPMLSNANRYVDPKSIYEEFATGHMVGGTRYLLPIGFDAAQFGARIIPPITAVYPMGFSGVYGQALVYNSLQTVLPDSVKWAQPADRWGKGRVWNLRQYIAMYFDPDSQLNPPRWPQWTAIENRTKNLRTTGQNAARIGDQQVFNAARPILPEGIDGLTINESSMVAMRYRPLRIEGMEAPYISSWSVVTNDAAVISPGGFDDYASDKHLIENTRRYYNWVGGYESARVGYPMVADRIRELSIEKRYSIDAPRIEPQHVKLYTRYVDGIGYDSSGIGLASLTIRFNRITPRWTLRNDYGYPRVHNVTPELGIRGRASDEFGDTHVRLEWRPITLDGAITTLFGRSSIADRDRTVSVSGMRAWAFGDKLTVIRTGAPPYSLQTISLDSEYEPDGNPVGEGYGIEPPKDGSNRQVPMPVINQQVLYVSQNRPATRFGDALVESNSIRVEPGYNELNIGEPYVGLKVRELMVGPFSSSGVFEPSRARVSPHTVYAVMEAPSQAKSNHPASELHYVNGYRRKPGEVFGRAVLSLRHRTLTVRYSYNQASYGRPYIQLGTNYILPDGINSLRNGFHEIPGTRELVQFDAANASVYGKPNIWHYVPPGPREVKPKALLATGFSKCLIEHFHRQIFPQGRDAALMGTRKWGDSPYMWQGLRVGPLMPTIPEGMDQSVVPEPWVSRRVRDIVMEGFNAFISEYQLEAFDQRMRVRNTYMPAPKEQEVDATGFAVDQAGTPDIKRAVHYIRPDGNAHQYRKGAF